MLTAAQLAALGGNVAHTFADDEDGPVNATARNISVTADDGDGGSTTQTRGVAVNNVAPTIALAGAASVQVGQVYSLSLGAVTDPGTDTVTSYVVDWGDGTPAQTLTPAQLAGLSGIVTHSFGSAGARTVNVSLVDEDGSYSNVSAVAVNVQAATLTVSIEAGADAVVNEGQAFSRTINFSDGQDNGGAGWSYSIDYGDGTVETGTTLVQTLQLSHIYVDGNANATVTVTVTDVNGESASDSFGVTVSNVAPQLSISGAASTNEGAGYQLTIAGSDAAGAADPLAYTINWGDGTAAQVLTAAQLAALGGVVAHTFADDEDGPVNSTGRTVSVTATDGDGGSTTQTQNVNVNNVAPSIALAGAATAQVGQSYTLNLGAITDPGQDTVSSYVIDWGDGITQTVGAGGNVTHTFGSAGARVISVDLVDEDGTYTDVATVNVNVQQQAVDTVRIGDAPGRQSGAGGQWAQAWTHADVAVVHKADATSATESFTAAKFNGVAAGTLAGGDIFGGDLGVSGQSLPTSAVRQEIDGKEVLRFNLAKEATEVTLKLSQFFINDDGTVHAESGRLRLLDDTGAVVAETVFSASSNTGQQQLTLGAAQGFVAMELSAGSLAGTDFVFGGYAGGQAPVVDATGTHGSDFLVDWVEFDFPQLTAIGVPPLLQDPQ